MVRGQALETETKRVKTNMSDEGARKRRAVARESVRSEEREPVVQSGSSHGSATAIEDSAIQFFKNKHYGARGIRDEMRSVQADSMRLRHATYLQLSSHRALHEHLFGFASPAETLPKDQALSWLWSLNANANVLIFGVGDKRDILAYFSSHYLSGEDVLEVNGSTSSASSHNDTVWKRSIRLLLDTISSDILQCELHSLSNGSLIRYATIVAHRLNSHYGRQTHRSACMPSSVSCGPTSTASSSATSSSSTSSTSRRSSAAVPKYGGRYAHTQPRLFIVIHELCGPNFEHADAQQALSLLAASESVSIIATADHLNLPQLWDDQSLCRFQWRYSFLQSNFAYHTLPADHALLYAADAELRKGSKEPPTAEALLVVLRTFTRNHRDLLQRMCRRLLTEHNAESDGDGNKKSKDMIKAIPLSSVVLIAKDALVAKSEKELKKLLVEFVDHAILQLEEENNKQQVKVLISDHDVLVVANAQF